MASTMGTIEKISYWNDVIVALKHDAGNKDKGYIEQQIAIIEDIIEDIRDERLAEIDERLEEIDDAVDSLQNQLLDSTNPGFDRFLEITIDELTDEGIALYDEQCKLTNAPVWDM